MAGSKKIVASFNLETDEGRKSVEALERALTEMGEAGVKAAPKLIRSLTSIEAEFAKYDRKVAETGFATQRDIDKIVRTMTVFQGEVTSAFGSAANAPKEFQDALANFENRAKDASRSVGQLNSAVRDNAAHVQVAAGQWPGLSNALESLPGKTGKAVQGFNQLSAAFGEGWQIGMKLNKLFGTDMSLWEEATGKFGSKVGEIIRALSDNVVGVMNLVTAVVSGDMAKIKNAFKEIKDNGKATWEVLTTGAKETTKATDDAAKSTKDAADATKKAAEEQDKAAEAAKRYAEEQRRAAEKVAQLRQTIADLSVELAKQQTIQLDAEHRAIDRTSQMEYESRVVVDLKNQIAAQGVSVKKLTEDYGAQSPSVQQASEKQQQLELSLKNAQARQASASEEVKRYEEQQRAAERAIASTTTNIDKLTPALDKATEAQTKTSTGTAQFKTAMDQAAAAVDAPTQKLDGFGDELLNVYDGMIDIINATPRFVAAMNEIAAASEKAAGMDGPRTSGGGDEGGGRS